MAGKPATKKNKTTATIYQKRLLIRVSSLQFYPFRCIYKYISTHAHPKSCLLLTHPLQ